MSGACGHLSLWDTTREEWPYRPCHYRQCGPQLTLRAQGAEGGLARNAAASHLPLDRDMGSRGSTAALLAPTLMVS